MQLHCRHATVATLLVLSAFGSLTANAQAQDAAIMVEGRRVFLELAEPACALCHTLSAAGTTGEVGPVLDQLKPDLERTRNAVSNGIGVMPAYKDLLTAEQIEALSVYVSRSSGGVN